MIKKATEGDAKVFYELYGELRDHVEKGCGEPSFDEFKQCFEELIKDPNYVLWKIEANDNPEIIVGVMTINIRTNLFHCKDIIYVDEIVISSEYRNQGYGEAGLKFVIDYFKEKGNVVKVELSTDYNNTPARGFYTHINFDDYAALYKFKL